MRQLFLDSRDRISGTPASFTVQLPESLSITKPTRFRADSLRIPNVFPTISAANRPLKVTVGGNTETATMSLGNKNGTTLASDMATALNALILSGSWTVTYDTTLLSLTISQTYPFTIDATEGYGIKLMARDYTMSGGGDSIVFSYCPVYGVDVIYLTSPNFSSIKTVGPRGASDTLLAINVLEWFGAVIERSMPYETWLPMPALTTATLTFELKDRDYTTLSLTPNVSLVLTIDD